MISRHFADEETEDQGSWAMCRDHSAAKRHRQDINLVQTFVGRDRSMTSPALAERSVGVEGIGEEPPTPRAGDQLEADRRGLEWRREACGAVEAGSEGLEEGTV